MIRIYAKISNSAHCKLYTKIVETIILKGCRGLNEVIET